ncbi:DUF2855 family protein [Pseudomonas sp. 273]|uniref:DUF2855 family protein n=1 Tax=Pseudomonas sp. 273 TaxID=75692 RepID=UPI0023D8420C|nr:DUF2855 family protein [Pseudomonas sp. 273]
MEGSVTVTRLLNHKNALDQGRLEHHEQPLPLQDGEALLVIERCALTTNNITYAAFGDSMQYWQFFPSGEEAWGQIPAWGFARVLASTVPDVAVGERFYGYFPLASHLLVRPQRVSERGFYDGAEHRQALVSAYNQYTRCSWDAYYREDQENLQILLKPLFLTSAMLADFLADNDYFGAERLVFSSASSKTAYGTAVCLEGAPVERIGLTSPRNLDFVAGLGCYQQVRSYADLEQLDASRPTLYVDFAGDLPLRERVHRHFADSLRYSCMAGSAQVAAPADLSALQGPGPQLFFAPVQIRKRNADWGPEKVSQYIGEGLLDFYRRVSRGPQPLLRVVESEGLEAAQRVVADLLHGRVSADEGHVIRLPG